MLILRRLDKGVYRLSVNSCRIEGGYGNISQLLKVEYEVPAEELDIALQTADQLNHDTMHFDVRTGMFTHSSSSGQIRKVMNELKAMRVVKKELQAKHKNKDYYYKELHDLYDRFVTLAWVFDEEEALSLLDYSDDEAA